MAKRPVGKILHDLMLSHDPSVRYQRIRIIYTLKLAMNLGIFKNSKRIINIGGGFLSLVNELWDSAFPDTCIEATTTNLHEDLPFEKNTFDGAIFTEVAEHIGDLNFMSSNTNFSGLIHLICEIARVLETDAKCMMTTPNVASVLNISLLLRGSSPFMYPLHYREYTRYELEKILDIAGVDIVYFDSHNVFLKDEKLINKILELLAANRMPLENRGDDFFIVFSKPLGWEYPEITLPALQVYPDMKREPILPNSVFHDE